MYDKLSEYSVDVGGRPNVPAAITVPVNPIRPQPLHFLPVFALALALVNMNLLEKHVGTVENDRLRTCCRTSNRAESSQLNDPDVGWLVVGAKLGANVTTELRLCVPRLLRCALIFRHISSHVSYTGTKSLSSPGSATPPIPRPISSILDNCILTIYLGIRMLVFTCHLARRYLWNHLGPAS